MRLGVDFGTMYTRIAARDAAGVTAPVTGPDADDDGQIETAVAVGAAGITRVGRHAHEAGHADRADQAQLYERFVTLLAEPPSARPPDGWPGGHQPSTVAQLFLTRTLHAAAGGRPPACVVLAVPEAWKADAPGEPAERLERMLRADAGIAEVRTVGQATAVAAALLHRDAVSATGTLLVCDFGATVTTTLCFGAGRLATSTVDGGEFADLDAAIARLLLARDTGPRPADPRAALTAKRRAVERARRGHDQGHLREALELVAEYGAKMHPTRLFAVDGVRVTAGDLIGCFEPTRAGVERHLRDLAARRPELGAGRGWRVAVVGGGSLSPLTRGLVERALGIPDGDPYEQVVAIGERERPWLAAYGAALIAEGLAEPGDSYPHEIRLRAHRIVDGLLRETPLTVAAAGALRAGATRPLFASADGAPVAIEFTAGDERPVQLDVRLGADWTPVPLPAAARPPAGRFHVGLRMTDRLTFVLECRPAGGAAEAWTHPIDTLPAP